MLRQKSEDASARSLPKLKQRKKLSVMWVEF